jgi:hypothetical protein
MITTKKFTKKSSVDDTRFEDDNLDGIQTTGFSKAAPFDDEDDDFDLPLDDLDTLDTFDSDDDDDY